MDINYCNFVNTIPQFGGTCWFNSILMASLYSEGSRNLLLKLSKKWDKSNNFLMVIKNILKNHYFNSTKTNKFFKKVKPEAILFKMLQTFNDKFLKQFLKYKIKHLGYSNLGWYNEDIIKFYKYLGVNCLDIIYLKKNNEYLINYDKNFKYKQDTKNPNQIINEKFTKSNVLLRNFGEEYKEVKEILDKVPDVLIINHSELNDDYVKEVEKINISYKKYNREAANAHNLKTYKIKQDNTIKNYEKIVNFNGHKYKLDSCLISNYDTDSGIGHSIVGLTCRDSGYVYNGWNINTVDAAIINDLNELKNKNKVCSLMPFEWDLKTNTEFCLNKSLCKLDFLKENEKQKLCFSFNKGSRILVYVRINANISEENHKYQSESYVSSKYISNMSEIIEDMYDIKNLTRKELINSLMIYNVIDTDNMTDDELKNLLLEKIKKKEFKIRPEVNQKTNLEVKAKKEPKVKPKKELKINQKTNLEIKREKEPEIKPKKELKITKKYLIEQIKIKQPNKKGLTTKTKDELLLILNEPIEQNKKIILSVAFNKKTKKYLIEEIKIKYPNLKNLLSKTKDQLIEILNETRLFMF